MENATNKMIEVILRRYTKDTNKTMEYLTNGEKIQDWIDFMFLNEPIAAEIRSYCEHYSIPEIEMYKLIALGFMTWKTKRLTEDFKKAQQSKTPFQCEIFEDCNLCREKGKHE